MVRNQSVTAETECKSPKHSNIINDTQENKRADLSIKTSDSSNGTSSTTESLNIIPSSSDVNATGCFDETPGDMEANPNKKG